jgi:transcriptional regulator with XRE-family HTH domain
MSEGFEQRLQEAFGFATMAVIARRLGIPHATIRNYFKGRMPAPEVLIKIANETNVSLNWLLIGKGEMYAGEPKNIDLGDLLDKRIEQVIDRKLAARSGQPIQELGMVDAPPAFDVESSLRRHNDPHLVMSEWFKHEARDYPQDFGVVFFQGWETYTEREKLEAIRDAKKVLDRTLRTKK